MQVKEIWRLQNVRFMYKFKIKNKHIIKYYPVQNKNHMKVIL